MGVDTNKSRINYKIQFNTKPVIVFIILFILLNYVYRYFYNHVEYRILLILKYIRISCIFFRNYKSFAHNVVAAALENLFVHV